MILAWMLTYLAVSTLLLVVSFGADAVLAHLRRPRRWAWAITMLGMCALPMVMRTVPRGDEVLAATRSPVVESASPTRAAPLRDVPANARTAPPSVLPRVLATAATPNRIVVEPNSILQRGERLALLAWSLASLLCAVTVFGAYRRMARVRRTWSRASSEVVAEVRSLAGSRAVVWYSENIGPAAFGVLRPQVVVPAWVDTLPPDARSLLLRHEASHLAAHDPLLLRIALAAVVCSPWNLPLLLAYRRLHRALEHDCDARVLAATRDARGYGRLLLDMAERLTQMPRALSWSRAARWLPAPIPGIGTQRSELEARLQAMVPRPSTWRSRGRAAAAGSAAVAGVIAACTVPSPEPARSETQRGALTSDAVAPLARPVPQPALIGSANGTTSSIDSIMMFERLQGAMEKLTPRGRALLDSAVAAAARTAFPDVFDTAQSNDEFVWMLLDPAYRVVRTARGKEFYSMRLKRSDGTEKRIPVGASTGPVYLSVGTEEIMRAFPGLRREQIGMWSDEVAVSGKRKVRIVWARYLGDAAVKPIGEMRSDFPEVSKPRPWERAKAISSQERFAPWIQLIASQYARELLAQSRNETPVLWLLLNNDGDKLAHGSGRQGLYGSSQGRVPLATTGFAPATTMTADNDLGINCSAFREKFPDATRGMMAHTCGMLRHAVGDRHIVVVFGIANPPG